MDVIRVKNLGKELYQRWVFASLLSGSNHIFGVWIRLQESSEKTDAYVQRIIAEVAIIDLWPIDNYIDQLLDYRAVLLFSQLLSVSAGFSFFSSNESHD